MGYLPYQLVQDFFHQPYEANNYDPIEAPPQQESFQKILSLIGGAIVYCSKKNDISRYPVLVSYLSSNDRVARFLKVQQLHDVMSQQTSTNVTDAISTGELPLLQALPPCSTLGHGTATVTSDIADGLQLLLVGGWQLWWLQFANGENNGFSEEIGGGWIFF